MKMKLLPAVTLLCVLLIRLYKCQPCPPLRFGKACRLNCHCYNKQRDCQHGQGGRGGCEDCVKPYSKAALCQRLDAAQGQPTLQSSSRSTNEAALAADGDMGTCSSSSNYTWWQVDLGLLRNVKWIYVFNGRSHDDRYMGFSVYVTNSSLHAEFNPSLPRLEDKHCHTDELGNAYIACPSAIRGRYVIIHQKPPRILELCDVEIYVCTDYTFGKNCYLECNCNNVTEICDKITGKCLSGCRAGFTGVDCHTEYRNDTCEREECVDGKFGEDCAYSCNCKSADEVCSKVDGWCRSGCAKGFTGVRCDQAIAATDTHDSLLPAVVGLAVATSLLSIAIISIGIVYFVRSSPEKNAENKNTIELGASSRDDNRTHHHHASDYDNTRSISRTSVRSTAVSDRVNKAMSNKVDTANQNTYYEGGF